MKYYSTSNMTSNYAWCCDINNSIEAQKGNGVISGLSITATETPDMQTHIAKGVYVANNVKVIKSSTTDLTHDSAHSTNDRYDIICAKSDGTVYIVKGTSATPGTQKPPNLTAGEILLAIIFIEHNDTQITSGDIEDCRIFKEYGEYVIGNYEIFYDFPDASMDYSSYTKVYEKTISYLNASPSTIRIEFSMACDGQNQTPAVVYGKIYKNGVAHGTERILRLTAAWGGGNTQNTSYNVFSEDLSFAEGDKLQIYGYATGDGYPGSWYTPKLKHIRIGGSQEKKGGIHLT